MTETHTQRAHAKLAPSASHRWMECPGSIKLSEGIPNTSSVFAAEGTAAHELASHCLEMNADPSAFAGMFVDIMATDAAKRFVDTPEDTDDENRFFEVDEDMVDGVSMYCDHVRSLMGDPENFLLGVEQKLDMTHIHGEIYGTGDATVLDMANSHLHVIDLKYGKGVIVEVKDNPQLLLYAAGAARRNHNHRINRLTMHVVQPRAEHKDGRVRKFDIDLIDLIEFEADIGAAAVRTDEAASTYGAANWDGEFLKAGEWCGFCPAQAACPARRKKAFADALAEFGEIEDEVKFMKPEEMTEEQLGAVLRNADDLNAYVKAVQQFGHDRAMAGKLPKGFKLVAKRANRKWRDEEAAREHLEVLGVPKHMQFEEPKFKSPAKLESFFPGKNKEQRQKAMADLVEKKSSGFNLVPAEDSRPAVNLGAKAEFEALEGVE